MDELCYCDNWEIHTGERASMTGLRVKRDSFASQSLVVPWEGLLKCALTEDKKKYLTLWPELRKMSKCSIVPLVADFYLYEHMQRNNPTATNYQSSLVLQWTRMFEEYLHLAMVSELCHHRAFSESFATADAETAMYGWGVLGKIVGKEQLIRYAIEMFSEKWNGHFGGGKWLTVAKVALHEETGWIGNQRFTFKLFLDQVFSLEHNTNVLLSKDNFKTIKSGPYLPGHLHKVLDYHHNGDMESLSAHASPEAQNLFIDFKK